MEQLPKIVQQRLGKTTKPAVHPDPDLLTAFAEKSLNDRERTIVLQHLAQCADCRDVVSTAMPPIEIQPTPGRERSSWLSWPVLRWGAAAACVVVVGTAVTLHYDRRSTPDLYVARKSASVESDADSRPNAQSFPARSQSTIVSSPLAASAVAQPQDKKSLSTDMPARTPVSAVHKRDSFADQPAAPALAPKPAAPEQMAKTRRSDGLDYTSRATSQTVTAESNSATPMEQKAAASALKAKDESTTNELHKEAQVAGSIGGATLPSPKADLISAETIAVASGASASRSKVVGNSPRWTISADGNLQRSIDSGKNWQTIPVASGIAFRTLSANGSDIWVGGAAGSLYHSYDAGDHWTQIKPAADGKSLTSDILTLEFTDTRHGTLTTTNRETWITEDAGETWLIQ